LSIRYHITITFTIDYCDRYTNSQPNKWKRKGLIIHRYFNGLRKNGAVLFQIPRTLSTES
jgi:hypothetical protein